VSLHDIIAEEQERHDGESSGAFVERSERSERRTSQFWSYIGNRHMAESPELYSAEEIERFAPNAVVGGHARTGSVATDFDGEGYGFGRPDLMWSPLEGRGERERVVVTTPS